MPELGPLDGDVSSRVEKSPVEPEVAAGIAGEPATPLSRRIARRTTDLIAISLIAIAGLTVARRLIVWWKTDPAETTSATAKAFSPDALAPWGVGPQGAEVAFGDSPFSMRRQVVVGRAEQALDVLERNCRERLQSGGLAPPPITDAERRLLGQLSRLVPVASDASAGWSVYRLTGPLAMVLGVGRSGEADGGALRVLCWGLAFPAVEDAWTVLTVEPRTAAATGTAGVVELPASTVRLLAVSDEWGGGLVTFSGDGPPGEWKSHFDAEARRDGWSPIREWRIAADSWGTAWQDEGRRIDVQFTRADRRWAGLVHISPVRDKGTHP